MVSTPNNTTLPQTMCTLHDITGINYLLLAILKTGLEKNKTKIAWLDILKTSLIILVYFIRYQNVLHTHV